MPARAMAAFHALVMIGWCHSANSARPVVPTIAARPNVGRSTFYEHYRTKHDLLCSSLAGPFSILAIWSRPRVRAVGPPRVPRDVTARQIADAQLALVEMWVRGRPGLDLDIAAEALRRACALSECGG